MRNGVKPIVRLRFANGGELRCTPNHRIWTLNRGYVRAEELTSEDQVLLNDSPTPASRRSWELPRQGEDAREVGSPWRLGVPIRSCPIVGARDSAELTGHLVGDGWLTDVQTGWVYGGDDIDGRPGGRSRRDCSES